MSGVVVWFTGLPASGKSTLARAVAAALAARGRAPVVLDGDEVRAVLSPAPGHDPAARDGFYRTLADLAALIAAQGHVVLVAATAHLRVWRERARARAPRLIEVHLTAGAEVCAARDVKGLWRAHAIGAAPALPDAATYEAPLAPEVIARGGDDAGALARVVDLVT
jgi:adenylylsulfate kinase